MAWFGGGAVLATPVFLGVVALIVGSMNLLMNAMLIQVLKLMVGIVLMGFGVKIFFQKKS